MRRKLLVAACSIALPAASHAQSAASNAAASPLPPVHSADGSATAATAIAQMKAQLRNLVVAQERYYVDHGTYTSDVAALGFYERGRRDSTSVQVIFAGGRGWTGAAMHRGVRGKSCVIYVGNVEDLLKVPSTSADKRPAEREGAPMCDAP